MISLYLYKQKKQYIISLLPGMFYTFIITAYLFGAKIGFRLPQNIANIVGVVFAIVYAYLVVSTGKKALKNQDKLSA